MPCGSRCITSAVFTAPFVAPRPWLPELLTISGRSENLWRPSYDRPSHWPIWPRPPPFRPAVKAGFWYYWRFFMLPTIKRADLQRLKSLVKGISTNIHAIHNSILNAVHVPANAAHEYAKANDETTKKWPKPPSRIAVEINIPREETDRYYSERTEIQWPSVVDIFRKPADAHCSRMVCLYHYWAMEDDEQGVA